MFKNLKKASLAAILLFSGLTLAGCNNDKKEETPTEKENKGDDTPAKQTLSAPTDFTFDPATGAYSFNAVDVNAGYYFVRCFAVDASGNEATTYTVSSSRINGGTTGTKSGTVDISGFGWGTYDIKLVTFAASGTNYAAPDPVMIKVNYGVGGVLEKPEMQVTTEGNLAEVVIDWYTINDLYMYAALGDCVINFYSDEGLTTVAKTDTVDLHALLDTIDVHPAGGYIWGYSNDALHKNLAEGEKGYLYDIYSYKLGAGDYWVTVQLKSSAPTVFSDSKVSDAVKITLTDAEATGATYVSAATALWEKPSVMGVPVAMKNHDNSKRVDYAGAQTTTAELIN